MKILIDMNLSPDWAPVLAEETICDIAIHGGSPCDVAATVAWEVKGRS